MNEQIRRVEMEKEILDTIIGVYIFRLNKEGKKEVLLVQHSVTKKWYFPGGKVREGEKIKAALVRELLEELGIEYNGKFDALTAEKYEIKDKKLAILNVTARDPLSSEPKIQKSDSIQNFVWTSNPLDYDLTEQAREIIMSKMERAIPIPKRKKIKYPTQ